MCDLVVCHMFSRPTYTFIVGQTNIQFTFMQSSTLRAVWKHVFIHLHVYSVTASRKMLSLNQRMDTISQKNPVEVSGKNLV